MKDTQRMAEFYARLASIDDLAGLDRVGKEQLMIDAVRAQLIHSVFTRMKASDFSKDKRLEKSWGGPDMPGPWPMIAEGHPWARKLINDLLDNGEVDVEEFEKNVTERGWRSWKWQLDKDSHRVEAIPVANGQLFDGLREVILADPFPFDRCPICKAVFVPNKNQKYCGKACATKALAPWKAKYMKDYMRGHKTRIKKREGK